VKKEWQVRDVTAAAQTTYFDCATYRVETDFKPRPCIFRKSVTLSLSLSARFRKYKYVFRRSIVQHAAPPQQKLEAAQHGLDHP
jgi:hypothetical protein